MKALIACFFSLCLTGALSAQAQFTFEPAGDAPEDVAYVHILYKTESFTIPALRLRTTFSPDDAIKVKPNSYSLLKVTEDYIGLFSNAPDQKKPLILNLEKGQHYFYRFTLLPFNMNIDQLTADEFEMELFFNGIEAEPREVITTGLAGTSVQG